LLKKTNYAEKKMDIRHASIKSSQVAMKDKKVDLLEQLTEIKDAQGIW